MNFLDILILLIAFLAAARGVATGLLRQAGSLGGFVVGLLVGSFLAPVLVDLLPINNGRPVLVVLLFLSIAFGFSALGEAIGARGAGLMERAKLDPLDGALGGAFGFVGAIFAIWLIAATFGGLAGPALSAGIQSSTMLRVLDDTLPPAPEVTARIGRIIGAQRFPRVFVGLEPVPAPPVTGPNAAAVNSAVAAARSATVKVEGAGCGGIADGSGFVVGDGLVATNAHVVAGISRPTVIDANGRHRATIVVFDPDLDLAILRTSGLAAGPLNVSRTPYPRGTIAAVLGYPGGGPFTAGAAAVLERQTAVGRDIYDAGLVRRGIYVLQANVRPGNSGGPLVTPDGTVIGVIFASSVGNPNVAYAITSPEIIPAINAAQRSGPVSAGACLAQ